MDKINYNDIDFSKLQRMKSLEGSNAKLYTDKSQKNLYKMFNFYDTETSSFKISKLEFFSAVKSLNSLVVPTRYVVNRDSCVGYISDYIHKSSKLADLRDEIDINTFLSILLNVSKDLEKIHKLDGAPIIGDLHFDNIIVDKHLKHHFVDVDSFGTKKMLPDGLPSTLYSYCYNYSYKVKYGQDVDRLSFMLGLFSIIFKKNFVNISTKRYEKLAKELPFLNELYDTFIDLKSLNYKAPDVPYLHELISKKDIKTKKKV